VLANIAEGSKIGWPSTPCSILTFSCFSIISSASFVLPRLIVNHSLNADRFSRASFISSS
jgi:hypothetical protein